MQMQKHIVFMIQEKNLLQCNSVLCLCPSHHPAFQTPNQNILPDSYNHSRAFKKCAQGLFHKLPSLHCKCRANPPAEAIQESSSSASVFPEHVVRVLFAW